jgi:hypothetical protein
MYQNKKNNYVIWKSNRSDQNDIQQEDLHLNCLFLVRRNETICCLIGFGIGVGCCILYRLISNFLTPPSTSLSNNTISPKRDVS